MSRGTLPSARAPLGSRRSARRRRGGQVGGLRSREAPTSQQNDRWFGRLERGAGLLVSLSTLAATLLAVVSIQQVRSEQRLNEQGQITDRYSAAGAQLGDSSIDVRLTGIYALQRIMQDSPRDQPTIVNVLCAYVRTHAALPAKQRPAIRHETNELRRDLGQPAADVAAALKVIGDRNPALDRGSTVDLRHTDLTGADLDRAHLPRADLYGARLLRASFENGDLRGAELEVTDSREANFDHADMRRIGLAGADLGGAVVASADLRGGASDLLRQELLEAVPNRFTKLSPRLARDPQVIQRECESDPPCHGEGAGLP